MAWDEKDAGGGTITWGFDGSVKGDNLRDGTPAETHSDIDGLLNLMIVWNDGVVFTCVSKCVTEFQTEYDPDSAHTDLNPNGNGEVEIESEGRATAYWGRQQWEGNVVVTLVQNDSGPFLDNRPQGHLNVQVEPGKTCHEGKELIHISVDLGEADEAGGTQNNLEADNQSHGRYALPRGKTAATCPGFN